jgi:hypothetical protein
MHAVGNPRLGRRVAMVMRTIVTLVLLGLIVIACGQSPKPQAPAERAAPRVALDEQLEERLQLGLPLRLEIRAAERTVGTCTLSYDLWEERYRIAPSRDDIAYAPDAEAALRVCVEPAKLDAATELRVREMPHLYTPRADYPVF